MENALYDLTQSIDGGVAAGVVDLNSGMLLGVYNSADKPDLMNEMLAATTMDLFRGGHLKALQDHHKIKDASGNASEEVHVVSKQNHHFGTTIADGSAAVMVLAKKSANVAMSWHKIKQSVPAIEEFFQ